MKTKPVALLVGLLGIAIGAGSGFATDKLLGPAPQKAAPVLADTAFVPAGKVLAPLVEKDGRLSGYVSFDVQLEVEGDAHEAIVARLPVLLNAINMRTFRTPIAAGPDGTLPNIALFRRVVMDAAAEAYGHGTVRSAQITNATPA
jgi:hypothetical protein